MRFCGKLFKSLCLSLLLVLYAQAAEIDVRDPRLSVTDEGCFLSADFTIPFNARLEDAIKKGIALHFTLDFELDRARWYWWNEEIVRKSKTFQLSYHALTRQYRLSTGALHRYFASLDEALRMIARVRDWRVAGKEEIAPEQNYQAALWMRLDLSSMPRTFQIDALSNKDWSLSSGWRRWKFTLPETHAPAESSGEHSRTAEPAGQPEKSDKTDKTDNPDKPEKTGEPDKSGPSNGANESNNSNNSNAPNTLNTPNTPK